MARGAVRGARGVRERGDLRQGRRKATLQPGGAWQLDAGCPTSATRSMVTLPSEARRLMPSILRGSPVLGPLGKAAEASRRSFSIMSKAPMRPCAGVLTITGTKDSWSLPSYESSGFLVWRVALCNVS